VVLPRHHRTITRRWLAGEVDDQVAVPVAVACAAVGIDLAALASVVATAGGNRGAARTGPLGTVTVTDLCTARPGSGGQVRWYQGPPLDTRMRVPDEVRECVVFLGVATPGEDGEREYKCAGTGFLTAVDCEARPGRPFLYVVTAKHVADRLVERNFVIRLNRQDGTAIVFHQPARTRWYVHPSDLDVDVAVLPFVPDVATLTTRAIARAMFGIDDVLARSGIGAGDEVFITGLFAHVVGNRGNIPIVRTGNVAMMSDERVPTKLGPIDAYLIEARSIGGISGSPVFVRESVLLSVAGVSMAGSPSTPVVLRGVGSFYLLGLVHGHWDIPPDAKDDAAHDAYGKVNMGIAIVVPAKQIIAVLDQPELVSLRRRQEANA
jgi:hypothetical protein